MAYFEPRIICKNYRIHQWWNQSYDWVLDAATPTPTGEQLVLTRTFDSQYMSNTFYRGNTFVSGNATLQDTAWSGHNTAISTPLEPSRFYIDGLNRITAYLPGCVSPSGLQFYAPQYTETTSAWASNYAPLSGWPVVNPTQCHVHYFGTPPKPSSGAYGFSVTDSYNKVNISDEYKGMFIHPMPDTRVIRTAVATSLPSTYVPASYNSSYTTDSTFVQPTPQTITFDKAYDMPPLIFVTETVGGGVSLNYMIRDSSGKYVGASIVADSSFTQNPQQALWGAGAYGAKSVTFRYFIVAAEMPTYYTDPYALNTHGIKVKNSSGVTVFDSKYTVPAIIDYSFYGQTGWPMYMKVVGSTLNWYGFSANPNHIYNLGYGYCINHLNPITGFVKHTQNYEGYHGGGIFGYSTISMYGRYLEVLDQNTTDNPTNSPVILIRGSGTCAFPHKYYVGWGYVPDNASLVSFELSNNLNIGMPVLQGRHFLTPMDR